MRVKNWMIITAGFLVGTIYALSGIIYAYIKAPSMPGPYELSIQAMIVVLCGIAGLLGGYIVAKTKDMIVKVTKPNKAL